MIKVNNYTKYSIKLAKTVAIITEDMIGSKNLKRKGFSLTEMLITLIVIGVIAALSIPTLLNKYQKHTYVVGLKKAYASLTNAVKMISVTETDCAGSVYKCLKDASDANPDSATVETLSISVLAKGFKNPQISTKSENCGKMLNGATSFTSNTEACMITDDGMIFSSYNNYNAIEISIDINGLKGPNQPGRDIFSFALLKDQDKIAPAGSKLYSQIMFYSDHAYWNNNPNNPICNQTYINNSKDQNYDSYCTARVLEEDAMNY